jgi:hypothetical protein|tara:strand:+ start:256 stop:603 length:348 start_codon:yes stop_codon:yes gene_type:complete
MIPNYDAIVKKAKSLCSNKNIDYAQQQEPFSNFEMVEALKICDVPTGILVRISDKISRIANILRRNGEIAVSEEKLEDTMLDLINYSIILLSYYTYEQDKVDILDKNGENYDSSR